MVASPADPARFLRNIGAVRVQYGALCWRPQGDTVQVLLVTSRDTGRWIIPKGWPIADLAPPHAAAREAWEEAGVEGSVADRPVGLFAYDKIMTPEPAISCIVSVYPLRVARLRNRFPEARQRQRRWFTVAKAAKKVIEPELRLILHSFVAPAPQASTPAKTVAPPSGTLGDS